MEETSGKKADIGRIFFGVVCGILFVVHFFCGKAYAGEREERCEDGEFALTVTFFYQTGEDEEITLRAGRDFPLRLEVTAKEEGFCGYVNVLMQNEQENHVLYQQRVETAQPGEGVSYQMLLPMNLMTAGLYVTLTDEEGEVKLEETIPVETVNYGLYELTAVFDPEQETEQGNVYAHFSSFGNRLVDVSEEEMEAGAQAMDALEIIVTQESVLVGLEENVAEEAKDEPEAGQTASGLVGLKEWVAGGKTLVVGASPDADAQEEMLNFGLQERELLQEVVLRIGNYEATRESILATNEEIKKQYGNHAQTAYIGASMLGGESVNSLSDKAVALPITELTEGEYWWNSDASYETLWQERGKDILRCYHVGKGNVLVFAVPITSKPAGLYPLFYYRMAQMVLDNLTQTQLWRQNVEMYGSSSGNENYLLTYIRARNNGISVFPYAVILVVYILILIPAMFLLLRHFGKTKYLWGALPVLSLAVMALVYRTGRHTRITQPYCTYLEITDYTDGKGEQSVDFSVSAPTNEGTGILLKPGSMVRLAQTSFRAYDPGWVSDYVPSENTLRARDYRAAVCALPDGTRLSIDTIRAFAKTNFHAWADAPKQEGELSAVVTSADKVVAGVIRNTTGKEFRQVYICNRDFVVRVGAMEPGGELLLEDCIQRVEDQDGDGWYSGDIYWLLFDAVGIRDYSEANILNMLFLDYLDENAGITYVFALPQEEGSDILGQAAKNPGSSGISVFIWAAEDRR